MFFVISSLKGVVLSLNPRPLVEIVVFITGLLQEIKLFSVTLPCPSRILYTMTIVLDKYLYVTMIGIELTTVIDPARKEPLHIL